MEVKGKMNGNNKNEETMVYKILLFGRGLVIIYLADDAGYLREGPVDWLIIKQASTIRNWGTQHGIGELQHGGPTQKTTLDPIGFSLRIPVAAIHLELECVPSSIPDFKAAINNALKNLL